MNVTPPEGPANPELEAMRQQVWQEIDNNWQRLVEINPKLKEDDPEIVYEGEVAGEDYSIEGREEYEAEFKGRKIHNYLENFSMYFPRHRETMLKAILNEVHTQADNSPWDPLIVGKTYRQIIEEVDQAMARAGISEEKYKELLEASKKTNYGYSYLHYQQALLEVFVQLRLTNPNSLPPPRFNRSAI